MQLAPLPTVAIIHERLQRVFPEGTGNRNYLTREMAAKTVFVMLYEGAIEGSGYWLRPDQITRMTDAQADLTTDADRMEWARESVKPTGGALTDRWYAANTREPIRDETLRWGLVLTGAVTERTDLPTTSPRGQYALTTDFAGLFDPQLTEKKWQTRIPIWWAVLYQFLMIALLEGWCEGLSGHPGSGSSRIIAASALDSPATAAITVPSSD